MIWRALALAVLPVAAQAVTCRDLSFESQSYTACEVDPATEDLRLFLRDDDGAILGSFGALRGYVAPGHLVFAMNAGMYHDDRSPVGLYVEDGVEEMRIITSEGPGNFGLLPNGVLCLNEAEARVWESRRFKRESPACRDATQSGPMLVIDGALHPRFIENGSSVYIRNGVGVRADGTVVFAISNEPVNFHSFGRLFLEELETPQALFLDGNVSRLHAPSVGRSDFGFGALGPLIGVVEQD